MRKNTFKYIGYYDSEPNRRLMSPAAVDKMNYIAKTLGSKGIHVDIIACGATSDAFHYRESAEIDGYITVKYHSCIKKNKNFIWRGLGRIYENICNFMYILMHIKRNEVVLVYHSLYSMRAVYYAKKIISFYMILEVEENYNDVFLKSIASKKMEERMIQSADAYIFPTDMLEEKYNTLHKPYLLIHGTYGVPMRMKPLFEDDKIHIVYAGILDPRKGGILAAEAAEHLSSKYHIHILGYGEQKEIDRITEIERRLCNERKTNAATLTYEGLLSGDKYIQFLQSCDIGLCTQDPNASFTATSFPSKILSYLANGLNVVSSRVPSIKNSLIGDMLFYYDEQTPEEVARKISTIKLKNKEIYRNRVRQLDQTFREEICCLIKPNSENT